MIYHVITRGEDALIATDTDGDMIVAIMWSPAGTRSAIADTVTRGMWAHSDLEPVDDHEPLHDWMIRNGARIIATAP